MGWKTRYPIDRQPSLEEIAAAVATPLWGKFLIHLEETYRVTPKVEYSKCAMAPGWNVKYKKSGKALCTLYPVEGSLVQMCIRDRYIAYRRAKSETAPRTRAVSPSKAGRKRAGKKPAGKHTSKRVKDR